MTSPYMNSREAAIYLRFVHPESGAPDLKRFNAFANRYHIRKVKRGRADLYFIDDVEAALRQI